MNSLAQKKYPLCPSALTLLEMVIALGIISILFAVALPAFTSAGKSWQSRQSSSEVIQNGRVLVDYIHNQLSKSIKIIDVSDPAETNGYIEFEDASGTTQRFDIAANNYVQFGEPGSQSELAGPVSTLQFTCYAIDDLDTPVTDPEIIRFVKVQTNLVNASSRRNDKTFVTSAFLQTNGNVPAVGSVISKFEFDSKACEDPVLVKIDDEHYLCAYTGNFNDGFAVVLIVDPDTLEISKGPSFEFENSTGFSASLVKIDSTHYLCAYANQGFMGMAGVLVVDPADWSITRQTTFDFELQKCLYPVLTAIDSSHFLCSYAGFGDDGFAKILTVDTGTWQITEEDVLEYDKKKGAYPVLSQIDSGHYLCAYSGDADDGWALVLTVNTGSWKLSANMKHEFDNVNCITPDLSKIDSTHYLCTYTGADDGGVANILEINPVN